MSRDAAGTTRETAARPAPAPVAEQLPAPVPALTVDALTVRFSGLLALDAVSFTVAPGTIHALIGPNGAGKSTCFNVVSGVYRATAGTVRYAGHDLTRLPPHRIARLGVARTFQNIVLTGGSVADNLMLGRHSLTRAGFAATALRMPSAVREQRRHRERAAEIADFLGLGPAFDKPVGSLAYGDRKRVEMARALCMEPQLLLLDEPVAGMHPTERAAMAETIAAVRDALGISILIVEHDMGLIMRIADAVTVLDFGRRIADGPPERIQRDPAVISAYLGRTDDAETGAGGTDAARADSGRTDAAPVVAGSPAQDDPAQGHTGQDTTGQNSPPPTDPGRTDPTHDAPEHGEGTHL